MIGEIIGNYRIVAELGRGGMGMVYRAEHVQLGRPAALKMLLPQLSSDAAIVQRFFNEARAASAIDHPGIVEVYDFGRHTDGSAYIVMALLRGESLEHRMRRAPLAPAEAATIIAQVSSALAAAHARGIVHRDLKPDNIFLVPNEMMPYGVQPKLLDFGIAKLAGDQSADFRTQTGMMMGTPAYMSPEQCMGKSDLDHRTDLYSLGCILYHLLGGRPPFTSEHGTGMIIAAHLRDIAPDLRTLNPSLPEPIVGIVRRLLEKDPAARFQSALELRDALVAAGATAPTTRPPVASAADQYGATMLPSQSTHPVGSTTRSGSAAQVMGPMTGSTTGSMTGSMTGSTAGTAAKQRSKAPALIGVAVVAAGIAGAAVYAVQSSNTAPTTGTTVAASSSGSATQAPGSGATGGAAEVAGSAAAAPQTPAGSAPTTTAASDRDCPVGQSKRDDTHGHCCWPDQAFSTAKNRCVGTPACPPGLVANGDSCDAAPAAVKLAEVPMTESLATSRDAQPVPPSTGSPASGAPRHPDHGREHRRPIPEAPPKPGTVEAPKFRLNARTFQPDGTIVVTFAKPIASPSRKRAWITVVQASRGPSEYAEWSFVDDGATTMTFKAPKTAGNYEVRLHVNYPAKSHDLRQRVPIVVKTVGTTTIATNTGSGTGGTTTNTGSGSGTVDTTTTPATGSASGSAANATQATPLHEQRFRAAKSAEPGQNVELHFPKPLRAATGERFWVTVVAQGAPDTSYGAWKYVPDGAKRIVLEMPETRGDFELRLHANYPTKSTNVVFRSAIKID